ncbi:MAG: hypothetical protein U1D35_14115 [Paracoccaceae bacterium]|nr:hypothetical protein [Paracoccaceae bacterium]
MTVMKRFVTTVAAAATALGLMTAAAMPAKAGNDDVAKVLAGIAAIAIIGSIIDNDHKRDNRARDRVSRNDYPPYYDTQRYNNDHARDRDHRNDRHSSGRDHDWRYGQGDDRGRRGNSETCLVRREGHGNRTFAIPCDELRGYRHARRN